MPRRVFLVVLATISALTAVGPVSLADAAGAPDRYCLQGPHPIFLATSSSRVTFNAWPRRAVKRPVAGRIPDTSTPASENPPTAWTARTELRHGGHIPAPAAASPDRFKDFWR